MAYEVRATIKKGSEIVENILIAQYSGKHTQGAIQAADKMMKLHSEPNVTHVKVMRKIKRSIR